MRGSWSCYRAAVPNYKDAILQDAAHVGMSESSKDVSVGLTCRMGQFLYDRHLRTRQSSFSRNTIPLSAINPIRQKYDMVRFVTCIIDMNFNNGS